MPRRCGGAADGSARRASRGSAATSYKAPAYVGPSYANWTGFYVGINGGYAWGDSEWTGGAGNFKVAPNGWLGGGTIGYNFQTGTWVWGIEGDFDYVDLNGTAGGLCIGCSS